MGIQVSWSAEARKDLLEIRDFITQDDVELAIRVANEILAATLKLADFPEVGQFLYDVPKSKHLRELLVYKYRVIYTLDRGAVFVIAVLHSSRMIGPILRERKK